MNVALALLLLFGPVIVGVGGQRLLWWWEDRRWNARVDRWAERMQG